MHRAIFSLPVFWLLTACGPSPGDGQSPGSSPTPAAPAAPPAPPPTAATAPVAGKVHLALSGNGLTFVMDAGATRHFEFGVPVAAAIDATSRVLAGPPEMGRNEECGAGPLDMATWPNGLTLVSQDGRFAGWSLGRAASPTDKPPSTLAGVGLGSTRRDLEAAYAAEVSETTLGTEFLAGGLSGVLGGTGANARIDALWAGTSCVFR